MYQFDRDELGIMGAMLAKSLDFAEEQGAPTVIIATLESALNKLQTVIDQRLQEFNEFQSIAELLEDVSIASKIISKNIEAEIPEYK